MKKTTHKLRLAKRTVSNLAVAEMNCQVGGNSNGNGCYTHHGCGGGTVATNYTCYTCKGKTCNPGCGGGTVATN